MDSIGEWRVIEAEEPEAEKQPSATAAAPASDGEHVPRTLIAAIVFLIAIAVVMAVWATLPTGGVTLDGANPQFDPRSETGTSVASNSPRGSGPAVAAINTQEDVVIDVEGAVVDPGLHDLRAGSRVGDAIAAAGGYAPTADLALASRQLNLAQVVTDGQQVRVPALGDAPPTTTQSQPPDGPPATNDASSGGLIDLNHATADELDSLPGVGPVTVGKIVDARTESPFVSVDELQSRGIVGASTFEKLRDLVTVTR